ncbi:MAG TPA: helix-turn-helix transcriptional regulator [Myxococcales bacterium]|jgi:ribosome-binding protein aMBF1 (putative translation factor)
MATKTRTKTRKSERCSAVGGNLQADIEARKARDPAYAAAFAAALNRLELARQLREARELRGLTQADLAARLKTSQPAIARMERGHTPRLAFLERVAKALGGTLHLALSFEGEPARPAHAPGKGTR